jgi:hypothetical protein
VKCREFLAAEHFLLSGPGYKTQLRNTCVKTCSNCREGENRRRRVRQPKKYKQTTVGELLKEFEADVSEGQ